MKFVYVLLFIATLSALINSKRRRRGIGDSLKRSVSHIANLVTHPDVKSRREPNSRLFKELPLAEGQVCYNSTPEFQGRRKDCQFGLVCGRKNQSIGERNRVQSGGALFCVKQQNTLEGIHNQPDVKSRREPNSHPFKESPRAEGEICYNSTPEFQGRRKDCQFGLVCGRKNQSLGGRNRAQSGGAYYCVKP